MQREHIIEGIKASPLAAFVGTAMAGVPWDRISYFLACVYSIMLIGQLGRKWYKAWRAKYGAQ